MLLVSAFAVFLGWRVNRANTQRRTVAAIVAAGGHVYYDWHSDPDGRWVPGRLRKRIGEEYFQEVVGVFFNIPQPEPRVGKLRPEAADELMGAISRLDRVTAVSLYDMPITVKGLAKLAGLPRLDDLTICLPIDDADLEQIGGMTRLKRLYMEMPIYEGTQVTRSGLARLGDLTQLRDLELHGLPPELCFPHSLAFLRELTSLERLSIDSPCQLAAGDWRMDGACLSYLRRLPT